MAEKQFGGNVPVYLESVFTTLAGKLHNDVQTLRGLFDTTEGLHDFETQTRLLQEIQAGVRATNILDGKVDYLGETLPRVKTKPPTAVVNVDMTQIEKHLGTVDVSETQTSEPDHGKIAA